MKCRKPAALSILRGRVRWKSGAGVGISTARKGFGGVRSGKMTFRRGGADAGRWRGNSSPAEPAGGVPAFAAPIVSKTGGECADRMWGFFKRLGRTTKRDGGRDPKGRTAPDDEGASGKAPILRIADLAEDGGEAPRDAKWPPDPRFHAALGVRQIVGRQGPLIRRICRALPLSDEDIEAYFLPAVWNVANFVHLLSASRDNHHRGRGGLFAHSLETALYAVNLSKNKIFDFSEAPEAAYRNRGRWILACALAALVHDVGKAVTDVAVRTRQGEVWNPNEAPLGTWLERLGRPDFTFSWKADRDYANHPPASLDYARTLIPEAVYRYLTEAANQAVEAEMRAAILGSVGPEASLIAQIVRQADSLSVRLDNEGAGQIDRRDKLVTSEPADKVMQTVGELIAEGKWTVNAEGGRVFVTKRGTFIVWTDVKEIVAHMRAQGYAGAPENRDYMASLLLNQGLIERPPEAVDTTRRLYWPVCPLCHENVFLTCVKAAVPERLFIGPLPAEIPALVKRLEPTEAEIEAWKRTWGALPAEMEAEAQSEADAYLEGLLADAEAWVWTNDAEEDGSGAALADFYPDDLEYNGIWGAEAPMDSDVHSYSCSRFSSSDLPSPPSSVSIGSESVPFEANRSGDQEQRTKASVMESDGCGASPALDTLPALTKITPEEAALLTGGEEPQSDSKAVAERSSRRAKNRVKAKAKTQTKETAAKRSDDEFDNALSPPPSPVRMEFESGEDEEQEEREERKIRKEDGSSGLAVRSERRRLRQAVRS